MGPSHQAPGRIRITHEHPVVHDVSQGRLKHCHETRAVMKPPWLDPFGITWQYRYPVAFCNWKEALKPVHQAAGQGVTRHP